MRLTLPGCDRDAWLSLLVDRIFDADGELSFGVDDGFFVACAVCCFGFLPYLVRGNVVRYIAVPY